MKSSAARQNAHLHAALASLNNGHSSDLRACCVGVRSSSRPNLVPVRPLCPRSAAWQSSLIANLSSTAPRRALAVKVEACEVAGRYRVAATTLTHNFIWPCNNSVLSRYTSSFSVSPFLTSKPVRRRLSLRSSLFGCISQGLHNLANHLTHVLGHHCGPLGLFCRRNLGCDSRNRLVLYQTVNRKVANGRERRNVLDGYLHLG